MTVRIKQAPTPQEIMAATGLCYASARDRLLAYFRGKRSLDSLFAPLFSRAETEEGCWGDLGLGPRKQLDDIQGETELERRVYGRRQEAEEDEPTRKSPGRSRSADGELAREVAERVGISMGAARDRVRLFRAGEINRRCLYAPPHSGRTLI